MNKFESVTKSLRWFIALLMVALVVGCGGSDDAAPLSSAKSITSFTIGGVVGTIDQTAKTIALTVPNATSVTAMVATFTVTGGSVTVGTVAQVSATTANDFTSPVTYIVTAADGSTASYVVTVTVAGLSDKAITAYSLNGATGTISGATSPFAIAVTVPNGTNVTAMVATFSTTGASVTVAAAPQTSGTTANDFTAPVTYVVTAANSTTATYVVTVTVAGIADKAITSYSLGGVSGSITGASSPYAIAVSLPSGTTVTGLIATFVTTGSSVTVVATGTQTSATTANDFSSPVSYTVHAADTSTAVYVVTVTVASSSTALPGIAGTAGANATNPTVNSAIPSNADTNVPTSTRGDLHTNLVGVKLVVATFDEAMDPTTIISATPGALSTFTLKETIAGTNVPGTVAMNAASTIATFSPSANLTAGISYTATISTAAKNAGSITALPKAVEWSFTTRAVSAANQASPFVGQAPIDLLTAGDFAILAETAITETGTYASVITGNAGLSAGAASAIGIHCEEMVATYTIYGVDAGYTGSGLTTCFLGSGAAITLVNNAVGDKNTAYGEAAARTSPDATNLGVADLSGLTIYPGLYKYTNPIGITTNVTLDAQGDTNAVWIFQITGDLTVPSSGALPGIRVILANGAKASNVFWQVAGSSFGATVGTHNTFNGNILSSLQVILQTGTVVNGRTLAGTQVVLDANPVTKPAP